MESHEALIKFYQVLHRDACTIKIPGSLIAPNSRWVGVRSAISDLNKISEINSIIYAVSKDNKEIEPIDVEGYLKEITSIKLEKETVCFDSFDIEMIDGRFQKKTIPNGNKVIFDKDPKTELTKILVRLGNEFQTKRGKVLSIIERKLSGMGEILSG